MNTGEIIKRLLEEQGKTQADLARYLGVSNTTVNRWIPTKNKEGDNPSKYHLIRIADFFDVPILYITGDYDYWNENDITRHLFENTRAETAWYKFLNALGYTIKDITDYSNVDLHSNTITPFSKMLRIQCGDEYRDINEKELSLLLKKCEKHLKLELL